MNITVMKQAVSVLKGCLDHPNADEAIAALRTAIKKAESVEPVVFAMEWPEYHEQAMGCGLEDRDITDRYEAMEYGWNQALEYVNERLPDVLYLAPPAAQEDADEWVNALAEIDEQRKVLKLALACIRWACFGECRTDGHDGPPPSPSETAAAIQEILK